MIPTVQYLRQKFDEYNALIFNGELPPVPISLSKARSYVGICRYKRLRKGLFRGEELYDFRLFFSTMFDLPEPELEDTVIHEMIHYCIGLKGIRDTSSHGPVFRQMMNEINTRYGRHIKISHKGTPLQAQGAAAGSPRVHVVAFVELIDGRFGIKVIPRSARRILEFNRGMKRSGQVYSIEYYLTADPYFDRFPNSAALRAYFVPREEARAHLERSRPIQVDAKQVTVL